MPETITLFKALFNQTYIRSLFIISILVDESKKPSVLTKIRKVCKCAYIHIQNGKSLDLEMFKRQGKIKHIKFSVEINYGLKPTKHIGA